MKLLSPLLILFSIVISQVFGSTNPEESSALLRFKASFSENNVFPCDVPSYTNTTSWTTSANSCEWDGIRCADTGHVVGLSLHCVTLRGVITSNSSLFSLVHLEKLILDSNDFRGSPILPEFGRFKNLTELSLLGSNFSGNVPMEIVHLTRLVSFYLSSPLDGEQITIGTSTFRALALNATGLREISFFGVDMSTVSLAPLANLTSSLKSLTLMSCTLNGELLETSFHFLKLYLLDLSLNNLHGIFPWSSVNLQSLSYLDLSHNNFTGQLPQFHHNFSQNTSSIHPGIPSSLTHLLLNNNLFYGKIPPWIYGMPSLEYLNLGDNRFTDELNEFQTTSLVSLLLGGNKLHGQIPQSIFKNIKLSSLRLSSNNFTGNLDVDKLSKLKKLSVLSISSNKLSLTFNKSKEYTFENLQYMYFSYCNLREVPNFLKSSKKLEYLDISYNRIHGNLPNWFDELGKESLSYLNLSHNFLTSRPNESVHWKKLQYLDFSFNFFSGPLPIPPSPRLLIFFASNNQFSGPIPTSTCHMKYLELLDFSDNNFSGYIPQCIGNFSEYLSVFDLRNNKLQGVIPSTFSMATRLRSLNLNGNQMEGPLPRSLSYCKNLKILNLGNNMIIDTFPNWLEAVPGLRVLVLRANMFHGPIGIPKTSDPFPKLRIIDLSDNGFNGSLPEKYLENFKSMINARRVRMNYMGGFYYQGYYQDSVVVTIKGNSVEMKKIHTIFTTIDFSNNNFTGKIPEVIGRLESLKGLNISHNMIKGSIPSSLGKLSNLEWLDLSCNELVGRIPNELVNINWLSFLNLSYNHLEGSIPDGKQFDTFNNNSYIDNLGLCGFPMSKSCDNDEVQRDQDGDDETQNRISLDWTVVAIGYASGVVIGISIGYMVLSTRSFDRRCMKMFGRQLRTANEN